MVGIWALATPRSLVLQRGAPLQGQWAVHSSLISYVEKNVYNIVHKHIPIEKMTTLLSGGHK